jgi:hypothetical protein
MHFEMPPSAGVLEGVVSARGDCGLWVVRPNPAWVMVIDFFKKEKIDEKEAFVSRLLPTNKQKL